MASLFEIEGIGNAYLKKLEQAEVTTTEELLILGSSKRGRKLLAEKSQIREELIFHWVTRADLSRVKGISTSFVNLLESVGVGTVPELALRNPMYLESTLFEVNQQRHLSAKVPTISEVEDWISQAKSLPPIVID